MSAATIASYGRNGQKDVCFMSWKQIQDSAACQWVAGIAQRVIPWLIDARRSIAEPTAPDRRPGEIDGAGATP
jgi:hypothetical protein